MRLPCGKRPVLRRWPLTRQMLPVAAMVTMVTTRTKWTTCRWVASLPGWYGWDYTTQNRGEHAGINLGTRRMPASASPASASPAPAEGAPAEGAPAEEPDSDSDSDSDLDLQCFREAVVAVL